MNEIITRNTQQEKKEFSALHNEIIFCAQSSRNYAFRMALALKRMRDEKLYISANYATFGDYTAEELGIKERQAYNYIEIAEKHSEEFLQLNAKLGVTKLLLLSEVENEEKKKEIAQMAESKTVKDLKDEIKKITLKNDSLITEQKQMQMQIEKAENASKQSITLYKKSLAQLKDVEIEKAKIEAELKKLKSAPQKKPIEKVVKKTTNPEQQKRIEQLEKELADKQTEIKKLNKKLEIETDTVLATFKIKFNDLQTIGTTITDLLNKTDKTKQVNCKKALATLIKKFSEDWQI